MMKTGPKKVVIKIASEEESIKNTRRTLKDLQTAATDKENLVGRTKILRDSKPNATSDVIDKPETKKKRAKILMHHKAVQTGEAVVTVEDLTSEEPSADYWKRLAEKRQESLQDTLKECEILREHVGNLQEENRICKEMLEESKHLIEVLKEMLNEDGDEEGTEETDDEPEDEPEK